MKWAFRLYDMDKDGFVTREEMLHIVEAFYRMMGKSVAMPTDESSPEMRVDKIFRELDKDNDDKLSLDEFLDTRKLNDGNDKSLTLLLQLQPYDEI